MKTYHVIFAYDVPCYYTVAIEAKSKADAEKKAEAMLAGDIQSELFEPEWSASDDYRIADIISATEVRS